MEGASRPPPLHTRKAMTLARPTLIKLLAPLLAFGATIAVILLIDRSSTPDSLPSPASAGDATSFAGAAGSTEARVRSLQAALSEGGESPNGYASLGNAYLQRARESADPSYYARAEQAFATSLNQRPQNAGALAGLGSLALARHDFAAALRYGRQARAQAPGVTRIYGVIVDAQVELGRYDEAARTLQRMVDLEPNISSYSRVSYFRELNGDLTGAVEAMRLAVSAGGDVPENVANVQSLLGDLELKRGRVPAAERAYRTALARFPAYGPAEAGLARVRATRGDLGAAITRYRALVGRLPLSEYVIELAETELAAGREQAARADLDLVAVQQRLLARSGVNTDSELALFEANHGSPSKALRLARSSWGEAQSVRAADALGWALTRAGEPERGLEFAKRALRLGSVDSFFLYRAGMSARATGQAGLARDYLRRALRANPHFSPLYAPRARRALRELG